MLQKFKAVVLLGVHAENMQSLPEEEAIYVSCVFSLLCLLSLYLSAGISDSTVACL